MLGRTYEFVSIVNVIDARANISSPANRSFWGTTWGTKVDRHG